MLVSPHESKLANFGIWIQIWNLKRYVLAGLKAALPTRRDNILSMQCLIHCNAASAEAALPYEASLRNEATPRVHLLKQMNNSITTSS